MKPVVNGFLYLHNIARQSLTSTSRENAVMEEQRPKATPYRMSWPRESWLSQRELNGIRHHTDVQNSIRKRRDN